jgi:hypothetical protein
MDSSSSTGLGGVVGLWSDPFLWSLASALFLGLAAGQVVRALRRSRRRADDDRRRRSARFARAIAYLSLGILALAGLFVLADKTGLNEAWNAERTVLLASCAAIFVLGACAGRCPLALGLPVAGLLAAAFCLLGLAVAGWLPLRSDSGSEAFVVARLLPYKVEPNSFSGQLELPERDSVPVVQDIGLASSSVGLRVECLELREPLRLVACLVSPKARASSAAWSGSLKLYRVAGVAAKGGLSLDFRGPAHLGLLDAALPMSADEGLEPLSAPARTEALFGLALRVRSTGESLRLVPLQPIFFEISRSDFSVRTRSGR